MTESTTDDVENPLNEEQVARAGALGIAKEVLKRAPGPFGGAASPDVLDLVRLARYILTGSEEPAVDLEPALTLEDTLPRVYMEDTLPRVYMGDLAAVTIVSMALDDGIIVLPGNSPDGSVEAKDVDEPQKVYCGKCGAADYCHDPGGSRYGSCEFVKPVSTDDPRLSDVRKPEPAASAIDVANALVDAIKIEVSRVINDGPLRGTWLSETIAQAIEDARPYRPTHKDAQTAAIEAIGDNRATKVRLVLADMGHKNVSQLLVEEIPEFIRRIAPPAPKVTPCCFE